MGLKVFFLFVLVVITFATGTNEKIVRLRNNIQLQNKLQKLLTLKRNDLLLHAQGYGSKRHHDGPFYHDNKLRNLQSSHISSHNHERHHIGSSQLFDNHPKITNIQNVNLYARSKKITRTGDDDDEISRIMEMESERMCRKKPKEYNCRPLPSPTKCSSTKCGRAGYEDDNDEYDQTENVDEVLKFLKGFDSKLDIGRNYNVDLRCVGSNLCQGRNDLDDSNQYVSRDGKRLTDQDILVSSNKKLRCIGKCARHGVDRDKTENAIDPIDLRCKGHACESSRNDNDSRKEDAVKVTDNVDAILLDTSFDNFLSKLNVKKSDVYAV